MNNFNIDFLTEKGISYDAKKEKWLQKKKKIDRTDIYPQFEDYTPAQINKTLDEVEENAKSTLKTGRNLGPTIAHDMCCEFLKDLARPLDERKMVSIDIEPIVVNEEFTNPANFAQSINCPGEKYTDIQIGHYFEQTMRDNEGEYGRNVDYASKMQNYFNNLRIQSRNKIINSIKFDSSCIDDAEQFLRLMYDIYVPCFCKDKENNYFNYKLFANSVRQLIWLVKSTVKQGIRRDPTFLCFSGDQGVGKSEFFRKICQNVLQMKYSENDVKIVDDDFAKNLFKDKWIIQFDEMVKGSANADKLKQIITSPAQSARGMFTEIVSDIPVMCTFCGTANAPIYEIVYDETGMRRYTNFEFTRSSLKAIKSQSKEGSIAVDKLNEISEKYALILWKSIDETNTKGYLDSDDETLLSHARTKYIRSSDTVNLWIEAMDYKITTRNNTTNSKKLDEFYDDYCQWCREEINRTGNMTSSDTFKNRIKQHYLGVNGHSYSPSKLTLVKNDDVNVVMTEPNYFEDYTTFDFQDSSLICPEIELLLTRPEVDVTAEEPENNSEILSEDQKKEVELHHDDFEEDEFMKRLMDENDNQ